MDQKEFNELVIGTFLDLRNGLQSVYDVEAVKRLLELEASLSRSPKKIENTRATEDKSRLWLYIHGFSPTWYGYLWSLIVRIWRGFRLILPARLFPIISPLKFNKLIDDIEEKIGKFCVKLREKEELPEDELLRINVLEIAHQAENKESIRETNDRTPFEFNDDFLPQKILKAPDVKKNKAI